MIVGFSGFGFPKAHGAAFGLLAYQSTWLRVHYGPEFLAALLDEQPMGFYPPDALVHEAQRRGIDVHAADVNASAAGATVTPRAACASGSATSSACARTRSRALVAEREAAGPFRSLGELASRAGAGRPALDAARLGGRVRLARRASDRDHARREALWRLGDRRAAGRQVPEGTQLALPLELPAAPRARGARRLGRDDRRLRDDRADDSVAPDRAAARRARRARRGRQRATSSRSRHGTRVRDRRARRRPPAPRDRQAGSSSCCSRTSSGRST